MGRSHVFALVVRGPSGGQSQELNQVFFELRDVLGTRVPRDRFAAVDGKAATFHSFALPVDARVLENARGEVLNEGNNALLRAEAIEERKFALDLPRPIAFAGGGG